MGLIKEMEYRPLGRTGLSVSALSFGASPLGGVFGGIDESEGIRAVHHAIDKGINLFDVSPYYGITKAETVLGKALSGIRDKVVLATKAGRITMDQFDFHKANIKSSLEASLRRLKTDYVDILQAHDIEFGDPDIVLNETYEALIELRKEGKCRYIGMTGYPLNVLARAAKACDLDVILSYGHFNLYNTLLLSKLLPAASAKGIGLINASATGMGLLTMKGLTELPEWHPADQALITACRKAVKLCAENGADPVNLAMQYVYWDERIATTLVGMSKISHVDRNIKAVEDRPDPALLSAVLGILEPVKDSIWPSGTYDWSENNV